MTKLRAKLMTTTTDLRVKLSNFIADELKGYKIWDSDQSSFGKFCIVAIRGKKEKYTTLFGNLKEIEPEIEICEIINESEVWIPSENWRYSTRIKKAVNKFNRKTHRKIIISRTKSFTVFEGDGDP